MNFPSSSSYLQSVYSPFYLVFLALLTLPGYTNAIKLPSWGENIEALRDSKGSSILRKKNRLSLSHFTFSSHPRLMHGIWMQR